MIALAAIAAYAIAWLLTARLLYARWRSMDIGQRDCTLHGAMKGYHRVGCCYDNAYMADGQATVCAMAAGILWPFVLAVALVRFRPPATAMEQAEAKAARDARYAEVTASNAAVEAELFGGKS